MPASDATFRLYENIGYGSGDLVVQQTATVRTYENIGFYIDPTLHRPGIYTAYQNTGIQPLILSPDSTFVVYENIGIRPGTPLYVTRQPQGWGINPTQPYMITVLTESASSTATAYENTI